MKKHILVALTVLLSLGAFAQQDAQYSFYMFNNLYFNPAYAGKKEAVNFEILHRQQWQFFGIGEEINGAPQSTTLSVHAPFKRSNNALGFTFHNDIVGPFVNTNFDLSYAYRIPIGQKLRLSIGARGSYKLYHVNDIDFINPDQVGDQLNDNPNIHALNAGAGIYFWNKKDRFYVGFSVPHLIQNKLYKDTEFGENNNAAQEYIHYFATAGLLVGKLDGKFKFYPSTLMKFVKNAPMDFDVNANFLLYDRLWIGAGYRFGGNIFNGLSNDQTIGKGSTVIGMMRVLITERLELGYAYDHTLSTLGQYNSGSHEMLLNFRFNKDNTGPEGVRITTPR